MEVEYLSNHEQATFASLLAEGSELVTLFTFFAAEMEEGSDYASCMVSFDGDDILRARINDSPYLVVFDEGEQIIILEKFDDEDVESTVDSTDNLDEDGACTIADIICSRYTAEELYFA